MAPVAKVSPSLTASTSPRSTTTSSKSTTAAADIIKSIDAAFSVASTSTVNAAQEVEDARRNARAASEVARRFMQMASSSTATTTATTTTNNSPSGGGLLLSDSYVNGRGHKSPHTSSYGSAGSSPLARGGFWNSASSSRKRKGGSPRATSGAGGTSQAHQKNVEDLVSLSLELDRAKQDLESERMMHDETRSELAQSKSKNGQLGHQIERLLNDMETQREASGRKIDSYEREVAHYRLRMHAAEEDAEAALDIANENSSNREQVEEVLTQALQQIQDLKEQLSCKNALLAQVQHTASVSAAAIPPPPPPPPPQSTLPHSSKHLPSSPTTKVVRFAESPTILASPPPAATAVAGPHTGGDITSSSQTTDAAVMTPQRRSLVASGRELLYRSLGSPSPISSIDNSNVSSSPPTTAADRAFESMSERRQRLKNRLKSLHVDLALPSTPSPPPPASSSIAVTTAHVTAPHTPATSPKGGAAVAATAGTPIPGSELERVAKDVSGMLRASGRRLSLTGRWWTDEEGEMEPCGDSGNNDNGNIERAVINSSAHLETLARHYCTSVEVLVDRKRQEVIELESLCALWEQGNTADGNV